MEKAKNDNALKSADEVFKDEEQIVEELEGQGPEENRKEKQNSILKGISNGIWMGSTDFDIDETGDITSELDVLVNKKLIKKGLENDCLYFVEGGLLDNHPDFINEENFAKEMKEMELEKKAFSSGDYEQEIEEIQQLLDQKDASGKRGWFEKHAYLARLFPTSMEQKPGTDFYGRITLLLMCIAIFVCNFFDKLFVTPEELLEGAEGSNNIFSGRLSLILLFISVVVIMERYISRADVRVRVKDKGIDLAEKSFFNKQ